MAFAALGLVEQGGQPGLPGLHAVGQPVEVAFEAQELVLVVALGGQGQAALVFAPAQGRAKSVDGRDVAKDHEPRRQARERQRQHERPGQPQAEHAPGRGDEIVFHKIQGHARGQGEKEQEHQAHARGDADAAPGVRLSGGTDPGRRGSLSGLQSVGGGYGLHGLVLVLVRHGHGGAVVRPVPGRRETSRSGGAGRPLPP